MNCIREIHVLYCWDKVSRLLPHITVEGLEITLGQLCDALLD